MNNLQRLLSWHRSELDNELPQKEEAPLRLELFNVEQLERHAKTLAMSHQLASGRGNDKLIARLNENEDILVQTYELVTDAVERKRRIAPAAEWLLDNFYLIEEQIRMARRHLPPSYSRELPRLANGVAATYPRVYGIVLDLIAHVDGLVDTVSLNSFIAAYQSVTPLKLGELWAVPIMLRLALIENLRRVAIRISSGRRDRDEAADWSERMVRVVEKNPTDLILVMADMARANPALSGAFLAEMTRHLQGQSPHFAFANSWLAQRLAEQGLTIEQLVQADSQDQAADQVSMGNSIISLRFLGSNDWRDFVEHHSLIEEILREDKVYPGMSFSTRDTYRQVVEKTAKRSHLTEQEVARKAIELSQKSNNATDPETGDERTNHVGYFLLDRGRAVLEKNARVKLSLWKETTRFIARIPLIAYLTGVVLIAILSTAAFLAWSGTWGTQPVAFYLLALPFVMCAIHLGVGMVNWAATQLVLPRSLPRLDFSKGVPAECRTMVVVPTMLTNPKAVADLLEGLEVRYLANRDENLHFALLTDLLDADQKMLPGDMELVQAAKEGIEQLNQKYSSDRTDIFYLFHRPRRWNAEEKTWMGYERKRGKLAEFNALLRQHHVNTCTSPESNGRSHFSEIVGDQSVFPEVRYVITLDTDTQLPRDSARQMVGAMAHPLNRPSFGPGQCRVIAGYGIMQPRVGVSLPSAQRSWFVRLFAGNAGLDPYTRVVSDLYQDLFGEGSFVGKGIYDVEVFEHCCRNYPENAILSHDLLESTYVRSALLSDVELYEEFPSRYLTDVSRRHRWMRGDWQIASWLLPWVPARDSSRVKNPISVLSWWKVFDNLRRSLVPAAMLLVLLLSWLLLTPEAAGNVSLFILAMTALVPAISVLFELIRKPLDLPWWMHLQVTAGSLGKQFMQVVGTLIFLPYEAFFSVDAILRTMIRMLWTRTRMLEWKTSSEASRGGDPDVTSFFRTMWFGPVISIILGVTLYLIQPEMLLVAGPFLGLWLLSPLVAWWLSRTLPAADVQLTEIQHAFLRKLARRTWRYFETFVTAEENWLPPDNIQEVPTLGIASRTSPTNIGMALLSDLTAYDFGYSSVGQLLDRTGKTFSTLARMDRHRGHFFNWYDTRTLKPLLPLYVSTVDSGNLAGHLLVLRSGLLALPDAPLIPPRLFEGLRDTTSVLLEVARGFHSDASENITPKADADTIHRIQRLMKELENKPATLDAAEKFLQRLVTQASEIVLRSAADRELQWWAHALERSCTDHRNDLLGMAAWLSVPPIPERLVQRPDYRELQTQLQSVATLREVTRLTQVALPSVNEEDKAWLDQLRSALEDSAQRAADRLKTIELLANQATGFAEMDFSFLFDKVRDLFAIGYNASEQRLDKSFYDLLASEARLASYVMIAQGQISQEHWFALGRMLTSTGGASTLLSWSGSMFEYLMPLLVMPNYENTLLDQTYKTAVRRQIDYGKQRGVPWGISESGYNTIDAHMNYQYRAFGVPGLGLKRGLAEDLVIAPYASVLALMVMPEAACANLQHLAAKGHEGVYGLYEAVDYTPSRLPSGSTSVNVRQYMAHHEGMSLLALAYLLLDRPMQRRFEADPMLRAADLLLQERVPKTVAPIFPHVAEASATRISSNEEEGAMRVFTDPGGLVPEVHLLSNGRYHVMITSAGGGYSRWRDLAVTRWREDATRDCFGTFCYLRDLESGAIWSSALQPTLKPGKRYQAIFTHSRAEFRRSDDRIDTHTEISISPEDDIELRRITLKNRSKLPRTIELTSYAEVVLALPAHDLSHPAFSNLFVQTEIVRDRQAILCTRRPRSVEEKPPWMMHLMTVQGTTVGQASYETDRMKFVGRGRSLVNPAALEGRKPLSGSHGPVLDPVICIRRVITLQPGESARIDLVTGVAESREAVTAMTEKYSDPRLSDRVFELAWTHNQVLLKQLNASEVDAQDYSRLAGSIIFASSLRRAKASMLLRNRRGQSGLWGYGISGDLPIVLVRIRDRTRIDLVRQVLQTHSYWRMKGLIVDLVIWNEDDSVYRQSLQDTIQDMVVASQEAALLDKPGGIFVRRGEQMSEEDRALLQTVARVILVDNAGSVHEQIERRGLAELFIPLLRPVRRQSEATKSAVPKRDLAYFNGLGGFSRDGREYVMLLPPGQSTLAPWVNVIANPQFGTVVSESGCAYTWAENSHEYRLTPWYNDPVTDACGEAVYLRDEETGAFWSPSPLPARGQNAYVSRHGFGYSMFEYAEDGIITELSIYVATEAPVKFVRLKISNRSGRQRQLSVTGFWELVLGELRDKSLMHVVTEIDSVTGAIFARNPYNPEFADRVVFIDSSETMRTVTGDRTEFIGRNGTPSTPAAMRRVRLSGRVGAGYDPCAAMQVAVALADGQEKEVVFILGSATSEEYARQLVQRFRSPANAYRALEGVWHYWSKALGAIYIETPDPAVNFLANGWLLYQTLACRMWARTGFYQSGGAFGFRDQLQDAMALVHIEPALLREHLLRAAGRQFREGDVQHWWHPPAGRGVRTHFSDDYLWLPYATCRYVNAIGDTGVLDESVPFLKARQLRPDEEANYDLPQISDEKGSLYEHCVRAIDNGLRFGVHGLPLMGCGDWNDGMNLVGQHGKGESVWLAFFLYDVLMQFIELARKRGDTAIVDKYTLEAGRLRGNIELHAWDGEWYRRAYFDDGTPLGSATNAECQIDSISQSWSILSGAGTTEHQTQAMDHLEQRLVRSSSRLIQLLDPPFDKSDLNPGYIKGYVPGVRENGGQYTHGAIWTVMAYAAIGDSKRAWELFNMINPINHGNTAEGIAKYRVEPYVVAADVYAVPPHTGRGGWTWYTGSAGWMYRLLTESLLGLRLEVDKLRFAPCLPPGWTSFKVHYRYRETHYHITLKINGSGKAVKVLLDGKEQPDHYLPLFDDRIDHAVEVEIN
ncbi:MAG TPA: glucoamylase family protein [Gemmatales bacterium]|nr:glucoamylase family protein [Gemmatales bacterium]